MSLAVRQAQNVSGQAVKSQNTSSVLKETASRTEDKVDNELSKLLDDIKKRLELIRAKIRNVSNDLAGVQGNFQEFDDMAGRIGKCKSLLTSLCTFFLISIRVNTEKPWPYIRTKFKS